MTTAYGVSAWQSTFHPDADDRDGSEMRRMFVLQRQTLGFESLKECKRMGSDAVKNALSDELLSRLAQPTEENLALFDDPVFLIWLRFLHRAAASSRQEEVMQHCESLPAVLARVSKRIRGAEERYIPGTLIALQQDDIDAYVQMATPPTYDFHSAANRRPWPERPGHPLALQCELVGMALDEIGAAWPEMKEQVLDLVKIIGYLPDSTFRSCSAARYSGVVYLGNLDESILDIEESIVHETGHQMLYRVAELAPMTEPGTPQDDGYVLPWSGSRRDLFGFLHAYYIYALLAKYFWRRAARGRSAAQECRKRAMLTAIGCRMATPMLLQDRNLTEQAHVIVTELSREMDELQREMGVPVNGIGAANGAR